MAVLDYGYGIQPAGWRVDEARAPMFSRVYLIDGGQVEYKSRDQRRVLQRGTLYLFPTHTPYVMEHNPADPLNCLWFHMASPMLRITRLLSIPMEDDPRFAHLMLVLRDAITQGSPASAYVELLVQAFLELCRLAELVELPDERLSEMTAYLDAHLEGPLSIPQLAHRFGYTPEYFIRLFKSLAGITPHRYLLCMRMNEAVGQLLRGATIQTIAESVGYSNVKSFSNTFKSHYGLSPSDYRRHFVRQA